MGMAEHWWVCPNEPPCGHGAVLHDIEEMGDPVPTCCVAGCRCPFPQPFAPVDELRLKRLMAAAGTGQILRLPAEVVSAMAAEIREARTPRRGQHVENHGDDS